MPKQLGVLILVLISLSIGLQSLSAQDSLSIEQKYAKYNSRPFTVSPFFWLLGLKGEIIAPPRPSNLPEPPPPRFEIDKSFSEIRNSIRFFLMLGTEYNTKHLVFKANVTSLILEGEAVTPFQILAERIDYRFGYLTSEITMGYRIIKTMKVDFAAMLGIRMLYTNIEGRTEIFRVSFEGNRSVFWYDPIMAIEAKYRPIPRLEFKGYTDFGPIRNVDSYQFQIQGTYSFSPTFSMATGFRNYYINSEAEEKETIYKGRVYGPFIRFGFQF